MAGPLTTRVKGLIAHIRGAPFRWALAGSALLLLAAILVEAAGPDEVVDPSGEVKIEDRRSFAEGGAPPAGATLATNGDVDVDNEPLWSIERRGDEAVVRGYAFHESGELTGSNEATVEVGRNAIFDIAEWDGESALFVITPSARGARVQIFPLLAAGEDLSGSAETLSLTPRPQPVADGVAPIPPVDERARREFAIATRSGDRPDLFAIDRGIEVDRPTVRIFSGESGYEEMEQELKLPVLGLLPGESTVDVARLDGDLADLFLFTRRGSSDQPEVHVLSGEDDFQFFALQRPLGFADALPPGYRLTVGSSLGAPTIYAVGPGSRGLVELLPLGPRASPF